MKMRSNRLILTGLAAIGVAGISARADVVVDTFNNPGSTVTSVGFPVYNSYGLDASPSPLPPNMRFDFGGSTAAAGYQIAWSPFDAAGNPSSGSLKITVPMNVAVDGGNNKGAFTLDIYENGPLNFTGLSFDVMADPNSAGEAAGISAGIGYFQVANRDGSYGFNSIGSIGEDLGATYTGYSAGQWQHMSASLSGADSSVRAITFQLYGGPGQNDTGTEIFYLDNIVLTVPEPSSMALVALGVAGWFCARRLRTAKS